MADTPAAPLPRGSYFTAARISENLRTSALRSSPKFALRTVRWHHACARRSRPARDASREGGEASMDFNEKVLYHQIHPAKLAADVGGSLLSTYLMWCRRFAWAMLAAFAPAVLASGFGYKVRGPGAEEALTLWALHQPLLGLARE